MLTASQVTALNELQSGKRYGHPYTCPNRGDGRHHDNGHHNRAQGHHSQGD